MLINQTGFFAHRVARGRTFDSGIRRNDDGSKNDKGSLKDKEHAARTGSQGREPEGASGTV
jgi:hypothetical protein